jgi:hypothetical protein
LKSKALCVSIYEDIPPRGGIYIKSCPLKMIENLAKSITIAHLQFYIIVQNQIEILDTLTKYFVPMLSADSIEKGTELEKILLSVCPILKYSNLRAVRIHSDLC